MITVSKLIPLLGILPLSGPLMLGGLAVALMASSLLAMQAEDPNPPRPAAERAEQLQNPASTPAAPDTRPRHADDGGVIQLREPSESWKANVFWGLLFGLLLVVPAFFAPRDTPSWKKYGTMLLGLAWMTFMGRSAIQNHGRTVRCDQTSIQISGPFSSKQILLNAVKQVFRNDVRQKLRSLDDIGRPRSALKGLDTKAPLVLYVLRDQEGHELLRLDKNMEPASEMRRFLDRLENLTGRFITDE